MAEKENNKYTVFILNPEKFNEVMHVSLDTCHGDVPLEDEDLLSQLPYAYSSEDIQAFYEKTGLAIRHEVTDGTYYHVFNREGSISRMGDYYDHFLVPSGAYARNHFKMEKLDEDIVIFSEVDDAPKATGLEILA